MKIVPAVPIELTRGGLIEGALTKRKKRLYRVIDWNESLDCIWLIEITAERPQSAMPAKWILSGVCAAIGVTAYFVAEKVKLPNMTLANASLSPTARAERNRRLRLLGCLIWRANRLALCDAKLRAQLIARRSKSTGRSPQFIYKLLTLYLWFGINWNALLPLRANQGAHGQARPGGTKKSGRPNSHQRLGRSYQGVTVGKHDLAIFKVALTELYIGKDMSLRETYDEMAQQRYLRRRTKDGKTEIIHIRAERIPTYDQFLYHARKIIEANGWKSEKHGELDYIQHHATYGGNSTDFSMYPGDVFDGDCTTFKVECQLYTGEKHQAIRQKTIAFWMDRASYAVAGFFAFSGPESWDVYRQALFVAFTAKDELCKSAGISPELWAMRHKCNKIFVDRGPARGHQAYEAVIERLALGRAVAPPRAAQMKSAIENFQGCIQKELSNLPGGKRRTKRIRDQDNYDKVIKGPLPTTRELNDCVVRAIVQHNNFMDASHLRTSEMLRDGVPPNPAAIFEWGIKNAAGEYRRVIADTEIYCSLLHSKSVAVQAEGIQFRNAWFQCDEIRAYREARHSKGSSPRIEVLFDPLRLVIYWTNENGDLIGIPMKRASYAKFKQMDLEDLINFRLYERASVVKQELEQRNRKLLTSKQAEVASTAAERFANTTLDEQRTGIANAKQNKAAERRNEESQLRLQQKRLMAPVEEKMDAALPHRFETNARNLEPRKNDALADESSPRALFIKLMAERKEEH